MRRQMWLGLLRDSIALRVTLAVFGALALAQLAGYLLFTGERLQLLPLVDTAAIETVVEDAVNAVAAATPERRAETVAALRIPEGSAGLESRFAPDGEIMDPPPLHAFRLKMMQRAAGRFDLMLVEAAPTVDGPPVAFRIWLRLPQQDWLVLTVPADLLRRPDLLRTLLWWSLTLLGAIPLSLLVARRLTAPIRRFSRAAEQLGLDIAASPLAETGPAELRAAAAAINGMQRRIRSFVDDRTAMLAAISHDLRTPISRLRLRAEGLPDNAAEDRERMIADLRLMDRMIAATIDFAHDAGSGEARVPIDLASLVETACETLADLGGDVAYAGPPYLAVTCRPMAIGRAVQNVLENAVEYGGRTVASIASLGDAVEIRIADNGPGIPLAEQERVFEPFTRLDPARSSEHSGLGLSIARNILRAHGGDVTLANRPEGGLLVTLRLPASAAEAAGG